MIKRISKKRRGLKLLTIFFIVVAFASQSLLAFAESALAEVQILAFQDMNPAPTYTVSLGTERKDLPLPGTLMAEVQVEGSNSVRVISIPVTWESVDYDENTLGTYTFTAKFSGYTYVQARPFILIEVIKETTEDESNNTVDLTTGNTSEVVDSETADKETQVNELAGIDIASESELGKDLQGTESSSGETADSDNHVHDEFECICGTLTDIHSEDCPLYVEPIDYEELLQSIINGIDDLPQESEIAAMTQEEAEELIWKFSDILVKMDQFEEGAEADSLALYESDEIQNRISYMNELLDYLRYDYFGFSRPGNTRIRAMSIDLSTLTPVDVAAGRIEINNTTWTQYVGVSNTVLNSGSANANGYLFSGTVTKEKAALQSRDGYILVSPGSTVQLFLNGINITTNLGLSCIQVSGANATITLIDNSLNYLYCYTATSGQYLGGALVKNGMDDYKLTIRCEHADEPGHLCIPATCGSLFAKGMDQHVAAIGSTYSATRYQLNGGFCNLYITGGFIAAESGLHSPGIGTMCGNTYFPTQDSPNKAAMAQTVATDTRAAQYCYNINISGGWVYAYGGEGCAGIGSGWGGPVDGIYISDGAYVYASGGSFSPGIGSGGVNQNSPIPSVEKNDGLYNVSNIVITGGMTAVEAVGYQGDKEPPADPTKYPSPPMPGIGSGRSYLNQSGVITNVIASPEENWYAMVKQGVSEVIDDAKYTDESPSEETINIRTDQSYYYTLVYFSRKVQKDASVNGAPIDNGTATEPVVVNPGDTVIYTLTAQSASVDATATYLMEDQIPAGMTLVTTEGSYTPGMTYSTAGGVTTVKWDGLSGNQSVFFTVTVDRLAVWEHQADYINQVIKTYTLDIENGEASDKVITSIPTYHRAEVAIVQVKKEIDNYISGLSDYQFFINLHGAVETSVSLKREETSKPIQVVLRDESGMGTVNVSEIVQMEFDENYTVTAKIVHLDGTTDTQTGTADTDITFSRGDTVTITVVNTYDHQGYFKARDWVRNLFE